MANKVLAERESGDAEIVDRALWAVALEGGSATKASRRLHDEGLELGASTIRYWFKNSHRERYAEIVTERRRTLDQHIAQGATALALELQEAESRAVKQTLAGLAMSNGVEASQILRNLSVSKDTQVRTAASLRRTWSEESSAQSLAEIAAELKALAPGVIKLVEDDVVEEVSDAEVVTS